MSETSRIEKILRQVMADPLLHARWLNTFSFLEYIGTRKIFKSQDAETLSLSTLSHAMEEGRHALGLKKLAVKLGGPAVATYAPEALLCGEQAERYFQDLDHKVEEAFAKEPPKSRSSVCYTWVTWLIEIRAVEIYQTYLRISPDQDITRFLSGLLKEEANHLTFVEQGLQNGNPGFLEIRSTLQAFENNLYLSFLARVEREIGLEN